jgi:uncharacterized protein (DUF1501 family)
MRIWQTARFDHDGQQSYGWLGRALDLAVLKPSANDAANPAAIYAGRDDLPVALWGRRCEAMSLTSLSDMKLPFAPGQLTPPTATSQSKHVGQDDLDVFVTRQVLSAYATADQFQQLSSASSNSSVEYPATQLGANLKLISQLLKGGSRARVYYAVQGGYDTHAAQLFTHSQLLREFSSALKVFLDDLAGAQLEDRVIVLAFSEFGRRVKENASQGTDHGAAGPVFLAGRKTAGGLLGAPPNLTDLDGGDLKMSVDLREIYAAILIDWLEVDSASILDGEFKKMPIFRA